MTEREVGRVIKESYITAMMGLYGWDRKRALQEWVQRKREGL